MSFGLYSTCRRVGSNAHGNAPAQQPHIDTALKADADVQCANTHLSGAPRRLHPRVIASRLRRVRRRRELLMFITKITSRLLHSKISNKTAHRWCCHATHLLTVDERDVSRVRGRSPAEGGGQTERVRRRRLARAAHGVLDNKMKGEPVQNAAAHLQWRPSEKTTTWNMSLLITCALNCSRVEILVRFAWSKRKRHSFATSLIQGTIELKSLLPCASCRIECASCMTRMVG